MSLASTRDQGYDDRYVDLFVRSSLTCDFFFPSLTFVRVTLTMDPRTDQSELVRDFQFFSVLVWSLIYHFFRSWSVLGPWIPDFNNIIIVRTDDLNHFLLLLIFLKILLTKNFNLFSNSNLEEGPWTMDRPSNFLVCRFALNPGRTVVQSGSWIPFIIYESQKLLDGTRLRISKFEIADYFHS